MASTYAEAIHEAFREALYVQYPLVTYEDNMATMVVADMPSVYPATLLIFMEETTFERAARNRSNPALPRERITSTWIVELGFNKEVSIEAVENELMAQPPRIARDPASGVLQQVTLELQGASYVHPVRGQPAQGTKVRLRFNALHKRV